MQNYLFKYKQAHINLRSQTRNLIMKDCKNVTNFILFVYHFII